MESYDSTQDRMDDAVRAEVRAEEASDEVQALRAAHRAATATVALWAVKAGRRPEQQNAAQHIAQSIITLLDEGCGADRNGDSTLDVVSEVLEEYAEFISSEVAHALGSLAKAAHAVGQAQTIPDAPAKPRYPEIHVQLSGEDGNAFMMMGLVANALRAAKVSQDEINEFYTEARRGDYNHLLQTVMAWVDTQ